MNANLRKVRVGEPLAIPAATFNAFIDAAQAHRERQRPVQREPQRALRQTDIIRVRNETGTLLDRFHAVALDEPLIMPADNEDAFVNQVALRGITPTEDHRGRFAIVLEPASNLAIVPGVVGGVTPARVRIVEASHAFADLEASTTSHLVSRTSGAAQLLWVESGKYRDDAGTVWAVVRLGNRASAASTLLPVDVVVDGGSAGGPGATCDLTYTLYAFGTHGTGAPEELATNAAPLRTRIPGVTYHTPAAGSEGLARYDADADAYTLLTVWVEQPELSYECDCDPAQVVAR